jgi:HEAT repeat protein
MPKSPAHPKSEEQRRPAGAAFAALFLLLLWRAAIAAPQDDADVDSAIGRRARTLVEKLATDPLADADATARELIDPGPALLPSLRAMEETMNAPAQIEVMAAVRHRQQDPELSTWLTRLASGGESEESRGAAYAALESCGDRDCLASFIAALPGTPPALKRQADRALTAVLRRSDDSASYTLVEGSLAGLADEDRARVAGCVARADSPRGMELLGRLLGRHPDIQLAILSGLAGMKSRPRDGSLADSMRHLLSSEQSNLRREAVSALGNLQDAESVEEILSLLGGEHSGVAGNAHFALKRLSGLDLPRDPVRWKMWLAAERAWWEEEGRRLLAALEEGDPLLLLRALHEASLHPLYQAKFAPLLEEYAESPDPEIQAAALLALGRLGFGSAPPPACSGGAMASVRPLPAGEALALLATDRREGEAPPPPGDSNLALFLLGLPVCLTLLLKVSGVGPVAQVRSWFRRGGDRPGPMTIRLRGRSHRNQSGP